MKKELGIIFLLICFSYNVLAVSIDMKENYGGGETIIAEIKGSILEPIIQEDIHFLRGHVAVPFNYGLVKSGEQYIIWAVTPKGENNYSLVVEGVFTNIDGTTKEVELRKDFKVRANISEYFIEPGAIATIENLKLKYS